MRYKPRLDGLRCIAILMVLLGHFLYFIGGTNSGIYGVNLFFVLSGFLITSILLNQRDEKLWNAYKNFIGRRALRIFPIYYLIILFFILVGIDGIANDWKYLLTYTYNFRAGTMKGWEKYLYAPYWSLSVEEQFYILFPLIVLILNKKKYLQIGVFVALVLLAIAQRMFNVLDMPVHGYVNLITNMGALSLGAISAWMVKNMKLNERLFNSLYVEFFMVLFLVLIFKHGENIYGFIFYPLINAYLIIKASVFCFKIKIIDKLLTHKWALFIGKISYGIYLYHIMIKHFFDTLIFQPLWNQIPFYKMGFLSKLQYNETLIKFPFIVFFTIVVAYLSFKFIEAPLLNLKDRYFKSSPIKTNLIANN